MGRHAVALVALLAAAACGPVAPVASPSARPSPTTAEATPGRVPIVTPSPAPRASAAAGGSTGISGVPTPRPALGLPIANVACAEWPADVATQMTQLPLPPSMCLVRATATDAGRLLCTVVGCVPVTQGCADQGQCLLVVDGTSAHYVYVFIHPPASPSPPVGETYVFTRTLCRLHQYRSLADIVLPGAPPPADGWLSTVEAREFRSAFTAFQRADAVAAAQWKPAGSDFEDYADVCAAWYYPPARDQRVADYAPLDTFGVKWLPLPRP